VRLLVFAPSHTVQMDFGGPSVRIDEKSEKFQLFRYCSDQNGLPMRASDSAVGGDADQVAKLEVGNRALIAAEGGLSP
jgi:hypothetical protein